MQKEPWSRKGMSRSSRDNDELPTELMTLLLTVVLHMSRIRVGDTDAQLSCRSSEFWYVCLRMLREGVAAGLAWKQAETVVLWVPYSVPHDGGHCRGMHCYGHSCPTASFPGIGHWCSFFKQPYCQHVLTVGAFSRLSISGTQAECGCKDSSRHLSILICNNLITKTVQQC